MYHRLIAGLFLLSLVVAGLPARAFAEPPMFEVKQNYRPTSGGVGIWITNAPNGYYVGRAYPKDLVEMTDQRMSCQDNNRNRCEMWVYGLVVSYNFNGRVPRAHRVYWLGWLKKADLQPSNQAPILKGRNVSFITSKENDVYDRTVMSNEFNCAAHECRGGKQVHLQNGCNTRLYYNALRSGNNGPVTAFDPAGRAAAGSRFQYRYTTYKTKLGGRFAVGFAPGYGWVYIDDKCIPPGQARLGGPRLQ